MANKLDGTSTFSVVMAIYARAVFVVFLHLCLTIARSALAHEKIILQYL